MKILNYKIILIVFATVILSVNCAPHCDDEDYARDKKEATVLKHQDSVDVVKID